MTLPPILTVLEIPQKCLSQHSSAHKMRRFTIHPGNGDTVWRAEVDGCWLQDTTMKKVDYLFWWYSASERSEITILVELKGSNFGEALNQIESTLKYLRTLVETKNFLACVVLTSGRKVRLRQRERQTIFERYGVRVCTAENHFEVRGGIDGLMRQSKKQLL